MWRKWQTEWYNLTNLCYDLTCHGFSDPWVTMNMYVCLYIHSWQTPWYKVPAMGTYHEPVESSLQSYCLWKFIFILLYHLYRCLPSGLFASDFPTKISHAFFIYLRNATYCALLPWFSYHFHIIVRQHIFYIDLSHRSCISKSCFMSEFTFIVSLCRSCSKLGQLRAVQLP